MKSSAFPAVVGALLAASGSLASAVALTLPEGPWRLLEVSGSLEGRYVQRVHSSSPRENPEGELRLRLGADLAPWLRFESAVTGMAGGAPRDPGGPGVFGFDDVLQDRSPSLEVEESWLELSGERVDVRLGIQKFAWGKLDETQPNDLLNPEAWNDPILEEEDDRKIGIPAASATAHLPDPPFRFAPESLRLTGVWAPIATAFRFPDEDERWYPPLARVRPRSEVDGFTVENRARFRNREAPPRDLGNGAGAARLAGFFLGADVALYYYDGYDVQPALDVDARGFVRFDPANEGCVPFRPACFDVRSEIDVFPVFQRIRAAGADAAYDVFGVTLRAEGAWVKNRLFAKAIRDVVESQQISPLTPRQIARLLAGRQQEVEVVLAPVNVRRDAVEWGFGADTLWRETFLLLQVNQTVVLDNAVDLLGSDTETRLAGTVRKGFLDDRLEAELEAVWGIQGVYAGAHPRLTYDVTDAVDVRLGYLLIDGHEESLVGQFRRNDQTYVRLRLSF